MGTTATNLHVLRPAEGDAAFAEEVERAYGRLGYRKPRKSDVGAAKTVILARPGAGGFHMVRDSDNDAIDSGELKELAVELSRRLATVAVLTSVSDSDSFEFIVWNAGKQVDAAVDDEARLGDLKSLKGKRRAQLWLNMFMPRDAGRALASGVRLSLNERLKGWEDRLRAASAPASSPFAEDALLRWCKVAGVDDAAALGRVADGPPPGAAVLELVRFAAPKAKTRPAPDAGPPLAFAREDEDLPYQRFHPGAWPVEPDLPAQFRWYLIASSGGFRGARITLRVEAASPLRVALVHARALPFYNGQVTSMTAVAARDWPAQDIETPGLSEQSFEDAEFTIPSCDPQSRKAFVIILRVDLELPLGGEATLTPSFAPLDPASAGPSLPPLRLKADPPAWRPLFSQPPSKHPRPRNEAIQRLNGSAVRSLTAILEGDGGPQRADFRRLAEAFLSRLSTAGFVAKVHSEKHMTASASISKATRASPLGELVADKRWAKLFDGETDYQTVTIEIAREGAPYPLAGFVMQAGLRGHGAALGLRPPRLTGAVWMIDHPSVESELGLRGDAMDRLFEEWIAGVAPTQAWRVQAAWIPEFDTYEDYASTLYEQARTVEPRDAAKLDLATALARFAQRLRFVSPRLWLGAHFAAQIDRASLERVATVSTEGVTMKIELRPEYGLADLEGVLAPIL